MEIIPKINYLPVKTTTLPPHRATNSYVIGENSTAVLIDAISNQLSEFKTFLFDKGIEKIQFALITHMHPDHYNGLNEIIEDFGGKPVAHEVKQYRLERIFDKKDISMILKGGESLEADGFTIKALHTPGHSPDHICFYIEKEGILFSGDTILGRGTSIISPPEGNMAVYIKTLKELLKLDINIICPAHGPIIQKKATECIQWYLDHRLMREDLIYNSLKQGPKSTREIAESIYTEEDFKMHGRDLLPRAERSVLAHLEKLEEEGRVLLVETDKPHRYGIT